MYRNCYLGTSPRDPTTLVSLLAVELHRTYSAYPNFFDRMRERIVMIKTDPQDIDYPYPTTNTSPLITRHALIVCGVLRCVFPCDDDKNAKEDDCDNVFVSRKQLPNATILVLRRQKPSTNALGGLYLLCADCVLEACWVEGCDVSLPRRTCV